MKTKKTLTIEIGITTQEVNDIIIKHLLENNEEFAKIYDSESKPKFDFEMNDSNNELKVIGCVVSLTKTK